MKNKIIEHAKSNYSSSPYEFSDKQVDIIIKEDCKCSYCGLSIFEMSDFPEVLEDKNEVLCEECFDNNYRDTCPLCEEYYEIKDVKCEDFPKSPFFYYNPCNEIGDKSSYSENYQHPSGVYEAIDYPVFIAACGGLGDTYINWENVRLICTSGEFLKRYNDECYTEFFSGDDLKAEFVCDSCWLKAENLKKSVES